MWNLNIQILVITVVLMLVGSVVLRYRARSLTTSIRRLHKTLKVLVDKMDDDETKVTPNVLTYQEHNKEINELHLTFNSVVKTMISAQNLDDNRKTAILNYSDAYHID